MVDVTYALGDIHGRKDLLDRAENIIYLMSRAIPSNEPQVRLIGDYVDIGNSSKEVMDKVISSKFANMNMVSMLGNHELWLSRVVSMALNNNPDCCSWLNNDSLKTIQSYGINADSIPFDRNEQAKLLVKFARAVPESHITYIKEYMSPLSIEDNIIYAHAGINPNKGINQQNVDVLTAGIDLKGGFPNSGYAGDMPVVMGHLVKPSPFISKNTKIIDLDTNAVNSGILTCGILTNGRLVAFVSIVQKGGVDFTPVVVDNELASKPFINLVGKWWENIFHFCKETPILVFKDKKREEYFCHKTKIKKYRSVKSEFPYKNKSEFRIMPIISMDN